MGEVKQLKTFRNMRKAYVEQLVSDYRKLWPIVIIVKEHLDGTYSGVVTEVE